MKRTDFYLLAFVCAATGSAAMLPSKAQSLSSEAYVIKQLRPASRSMAQDLQLISDNSALNKTEVRTSGQAACGPGGAPPSAGRPGFGPPLFGGPGGPGPGGPGGHGHRPPPGPDPVFIQSLGLSDQQREKLHAIREQEHLSSASRISELIKLKHQLMDAITGDGAKGDPLAIQRQINNLENANAMDRVASMIETNNVFTESQRKQLRQHMLEHEPLSGPPPGGPGQELFGPGPGGPGPGPGATGPSGSMGHPSEA